MEIQYRTPTGSLRFGEVVYTFTRNVTQRKEGGWGTETIPVPFFLVKCTTGSETNGTEIKPHFIELRATDTQPRDS